RICIHPVDTVTGCHPEAYCHVYLSFQSVHGLPAYLLTYSLGDVLSFGSIAPGQHDQELLSPISSDRVVAPHHPPHSPADFAKSRVSRKMTVGIVDRFEVIDVRHDQSDGLAFAIGAMQFRFEALYGGAAIPDAGERILSRL